MKFKSGLASVEKLESTLTLLMSGVLRPLSIIIESLCVSLFNVKWCDMLYSKEWENVL